MTVSRSRRSSVGVGTLPPGAGRRHRGGRRKATDATAGRTRHRCQGYVRAMVSETGTSPCREVAAAMAEAAAAWLDALDVQQRRVASGAVPADAVTDAERRRWFYTPTDHGGLTFHEQRPAQQRAAVRLVA